MDIEEYSNFVERSDWTGSKALPERMSIAQYGISAEVGSLVSEIKKRLLLSNDFDWDRPTPELVEELGDVLWYTALLAKAGGIGSLNDVLRRDLECLAGEIRADVEFQKTLDAEDLQNFFRLAGAYVSVSSPRQFGDYQRIAFLTARTRGRDLLHVCLTRLLFYATVMMSRGFPQVEKLLQTDIVKLPLERALGMIMWHVSAIATVFGLALDEVVDGNVKKLNELSNVDNLSPTPLHDELPEVPPSQRFPREFDVAFVTVGKGRLQMYYNGAPLGDELTDNSTEDDGYRFHDIMHLANAAKLGWSPVLRGLMKRKRKYDPDVDNTQDGARAQIVEEAIVKAVHSEAERIAGGSYREGAAELFTSKQQIPFRLLKLIRSLAKGLEVSNNHYWEWQESILEGHKLYTALHREGQGTVRVSLIKRSLAFSRPVCLDIKGPVVGVGLACQSSDQIDEDRLTPTELSYTSGDTTAAARLIARKEAILRSLGVTEDTSSWLDVELTETPAGISVKAKGSVQETMWNKKAIFFRTAETTVGNSIISHAVAIGHSNR